MKRRFVDLSIYLENDVISDPVPFGPEDPVSQARGHGWPDRRLLPRPEEGRPAGRRRLGGRERQSLDATTARISTRPITSIRR